jgi:putative ABC transport system substrate-binding protein
VLTICNLTSIRAFALLASLVLIISLCPPFSALEGEDILILRSYDFQAYNEAIRGFKAEWETDLRHPLQMLDLKGNLRGGRDAIKRFKKENGYPSAILAVGVLAASLAKEEFEGVPIIFCMVVNHERYELDAPNIAGISLEVYVEDQFSRYKEVIKGLKTIGVLYDPQKSVRIVEKGREVARNLDLDLITYPVREEEEVANGLGRLIKKVDALWLIPDATVVGAKTIELIAKNSLETGVPLLCTSETLVKVGALVGVFANNEATGRQAARIVQEVLGGNYPGSIGVEYPEVASLAINTNVARRLNIDIDRLIDKPGVILYP